MLSMLRLSVELLLQSSPCSVYQWSVLDCSGRLHSCQITDHILLLLVSYDSLLTSLSLIICRVQGALSSPASNSVLIQTESSMKSTVSIPCTHSVCLQFCSQCRQIHTQVLLTCISYLDQTDLVMIHGWLQLIACTVADGCCCPKAAKDRVQPFGGQCGVQCARQHCSGTSADSAGGPSGSVGTSGQVSTDTCCCSEHVHQFATQVLTLLCQIF